MKKRTNRLSVPLACAGLMLAAGSVFAQNDRIIATPTGWAYWYGMTGAEVDAQVNNGLRPIGAERTGSGTYDAVFVSNTGAYQASGGMLRRNQTASQLNTYIIANNLRVLDLAPIDAGGGTVTYDATLIANTGSTAAPGWGYNVFSSWQGCVDYINNNNLRAIDIDSVNTVAGRKYTVVGVPNTGNNAQAWGWMFGQTEAQVNALLAPGNGNRLIDLEIEYVGSTTQPATFNVIYVAENPGMSRWEYDITAANLNKIIGNDGTRLTHLKRYTSRYADTRYLAVMVNNLNPESARIRDLIISQIPDGIRGFAQRRIGGGVEQGLNTEYGFEPASCMKIVHGAYAVSRFAAGVGGFSSQAYCADNCLANANDCPDTSSSCSAGNNSLDNLMYYMFHDSNNNMTGAIENYYGRSNLNNWVAGLGLNNIHINHRLGCGGPPANVMSPSDVTRLYEMIYGGELFSQTWQTQLKNHMIHNTGQSDGTLEAIINQEAAGLSLTFDEKEAFKNQMELTTKAGGYYYGGHFHRGNAGFAEIPFRAQIGSNVATSIHEHTLAMFINDSQFDASSNRIYTLFYELLREPIRNALVSWDNVCDEPVILTNPQPDSAPVGGTASFTSTYMSGPSSSDYAPVWRKSTDGGAVYLNVSNSSGHISGANTTTLTISNAVASDAGLYKLYVASNCGVDQSSSAALTVTPACTAPTITQQPVSDTVTSGEDAEFRITAGGTSTGRTYMWQRRASSLSLWTNLSGTIGYSGATTSRLTVLDAVDADEGQFRCHVTNTCGDVYSTAATLTVDPACVAPDVTTNPHGATAPAGSDVDLFITASGSSAGRTYQWQRRLDRQILWSNVANGHGQVTGATTATLTLLEVDAGDTADYRCVVTNSCGSDTSSAATVTVVLPPPTCGTGDFDGDGDTATDFDIEAFFACLSGNCCPTCQSADFNGDGDTGTDADIEAFFRVIAGGTC